MGRWNDEQLDILESETARFGELPREMRASLFGQPMDGAIVVDPRGKVLKAAVRLSHSQERWEFRKTDGTGVGTRHQAALATGVWLSNDPMRQPAAVFVRSDSGGVHCIFGG